VGGLNFFQYLEYIIYIGKYPPTPLREKILVRHLVENMTKAKRKKVFYVRVKLEERGKEKGKWELKW
jgi:hypothetical protein